MKNLKKVLSLVLALAMALSLMTTAFAKDASDFADSDEITCNEAVDVMTAIGVFDGMGNNTFAPNGDLTREQAAKIITYMLMGKEDADKLTAVIAPYSDVSADRWSAGAIAYCTNAGIIAGVGGGKFEPTRNVTGLEFAKMLLVALGYDASVENLTGSAWAINAASLGIAAGLGENLSAVALSNALTREQAAQMAFNAEKATLVEYSQKTEVNTGVGTVTISGGRSDKANRATTETIADDNLLQFAEYYATELVADGETDAFENPATTWRYEGNKVGTYTDTAKLTYTKAVKISDLKKALPSNVETLVYYVDGLEDTNFTEAELTSTNSTKIGGNGVLTSVYYYYDSDSKKYDVTITSVNTYATKVLESEKNSDGKYDIDTTSNYSFESVTAFDEDTIVLYTISMKSDPQGEVQSMVAAESVTGDTTVVKTSNNKVGESFTMGGTTYEYSAKYDINDAGEQAKLTANATNVVAYVDPYGYVIRIDNADTDTNYAVVLGFDSSWTGDITTRNVQLLFADGTVKTVSAKDNSYTTWTNTDVIDDIVTYTVNSSDVYTLTSVADAATASDTTVEVNRGVSKFTLTSGSGESATVTTRYADDNTVFFLYDGDDYSAYVGIDNVPSLKGEITKYAIDPDNGIVDAVYLKSETNIETGTSGDLAAFIYVTGDEKYYDVKDVDKYYTVNAVVNGEAKTIDVNHSYYEDLLDKLGDGVEEGGILVSKLSIDKNNLVTNTTVQADAKTVTGTSFDKASAGVVKIDTIAYKYSSDVVVYVYDTEDDAFSKKSITSLKTFGASDGKQVIAQLSGDKNTDGEVIVALYYIQ